jgi:predicted ATPase/DNA-binding SARP family transcriptional activator
MQFRVLGPVEFAADGRRETLNSERQRAVLAALLAHPGETLAPERLADAVWDGQPPPSAHQSLHSHISRLRRLLATTPGGDSGVLVTDAGGYRLVLGAHELDAVRFEMLLAQARTYHDNEPQRAVAALDEVLGLWRGPAFGEFATRGLVRAEAVRLEELRAAAAADRADARLALGEHVALIAELEAAVAAEPLAERPHGQLMLALYRSGRQADALATYRALRRRLRDEVGLDPGPGVRQLHERVLRQDADLAIPGHAAAGPSAAGHRPAGATMTGPDAPPPAGTAAAAYGDLIGRDEDAAAVGALLDSARVVTLTGPAGVGKTRLAEAVVARVGDRFPDGVGVCPLAAVADPASLPAAVVGALGIPHKSSRSITDTLLAALGTRRFLLVLDNCEHLREPAGGLIDEIRRRCPHVAVLATSRAYLHLLGERVWEVSPLPVPPAGATADEVATAPAGELFLARTRAASPQFALTIGNAAAVAEICRRLDGIPLALELAAARIRAFAPSDLAARLGQRFRLLTTGPTGQAGRHRTLQAAVDWSYDLLSDAEAALFDRLSVFAGGFTIGAAEQVCADGHLTGPDIAGVLAELVDKSMVTTVRADGQVRYQLLDTMRAYGTQRLEDSGAAARYRRAHAMYHVELAEELAPAVRGADERTAVARIDEEIDNLRLAHGWLVDAGEVGAALRLVSALHDYSHYRLRDEVVTWTRSALALPGARDDPAYAAALATAARGALHRGELDRARGNAHTALAHAEPDSLPVLWAQHVLTEVALYQGRLDEAVTVAGQRAALAARLGQDYYRAIAGVSSVLAHLYGGAAQVALTYVPDARQAAEACGNHTALAWVRYAHGEALLDSEPVAAAELLEAAIDAASAIDSRLARGVALVSLASLRGRHGDTRPALELFREAVAHWRSIGDHTHQVTTLRNLVELLVRIGADAPAAVLYGAVVAGATPSFGAEAERLDRAWSHLRSRLGEDEATAATERGRRLSLPQLVDDTLTVLKSLLIETT